MGLCPSVAGSKPIIPDYTPTGGTPADQSAIEEIILNFVRCCLPPAAAAADRRLHVIACPTMRQLSCCEPGPVCTG